jgi:hypothetical protein
VPNFGHFDEMPLLLASRHKFVTLNIFGKKFSVDLSTRENWFTECVDLVAPDGLVFLLTDLFARTELVPAYSPTF